MHEEVLFKFFWMKERLGPDVIKVYTSINCVKFSASNGDLLEYNGSQGANGVD